MIDHLKLRRLNFYFDDFRKQFYLCLILFQNLIENFQKN